MPLQTTIFRLSFTKTQIKICIEYFLIVPIFHWEALFSLHSAYQLIHHFFCTFQYLYTFSSIFPTCFHFQHRLLRVRHDGKCVTSLLQAQGLVIGTCGGIWTSMALTESANSGIGNHVLNVASR